MLAFSPRVILPTVAALLCGAVLVAGVSPVRAAEGERDPAETVLLGGFALGDAIEGTIGERDGAFTFAAPAGGLTLTWDSRTSGGEGASGLPAGWGFGLGRVLVDGGVRVAPASGGVYEMDASKPSGLAGYEARNLRFAPVADGALEPRPDGSVEDRRYAYRLTELGGVVSYFDEAGRPVARITAFGERLDWVHDDAGRLVRVVDADGVVTELDWETEPGVLVVRSAVNMPPEPGVDEARVWRIELDGAGIAAVEDPLGGRIEIGVERGLVTRISGDSGSTAEVTWRAFDDGVPRVEQVRVTDRDGLELSRRDWQPVAGSVSSGWPATPGGAGPFGVRAPAQGYGTTLSDGATTVRSEYDGTHLLRTRELQVTSTAGMLTLQRQSFDYPDAAPGGAFDPANLPVNWAKPTRVEVTSLRPDGESRSVATELVFDELGRQIEQTDPDGSVTRTVYDETVPEPVPDAQPDAPTAGGVPIGLPVLQTVTAPDGSVVETEHELNAARTAVVATEVRTQTPDHDATTTALTGFTVDDDGFVSEQREYPGGDAAAPPLVTRWTASTDLAAGTVTRTETIAAGTPSEATTTQVASLAHGGVLRQTDPLGNESGTAHDVLGRPIEQTDASGLVTYTSYASDRLQGRNATVVRTPDGVETTELRDELGRITKTLDNIDRGVPVDGHVRVAEQRDYRDAGTVEVTDAWGATTTVRSDVFGREVEQVAATGLSKRTRYDDVANTVTTGLTPTGDLADAEVTQTSQLDDAGRTTATSGTRADGNAVPATETVFDGLGRELTASDGMLRSAFRYDEAGNPVQRTLTPQASSAPVLTAERRFDEYGNSVEKTLRDERHARSGGALEIDALGRTTSTTDQAGRVGTIDYSPDGLPLREVTGSGRIVETEYDARTRQPMRTTTTSPTGAPVVSATRRDPVTGRVTAVYDPADPAGTEITYASDAFGNTTAVRYPDGSEITHEYDTHGRRVATTDVTGAITRYSYDAAGLLTGAAQFESAADGAGVLASVSYTYDTFARVTRLDRDTGISTSVEYTSAGAIAEETTARADGATLTRREYTYDQSGSLTLRVDHVRDEATEALLATATAYRYDAMRQLTGSTVHDGDSIAAAVTRTTEYGLMVTGDIETERVVDAPGTPEETITERSFEYTPLGELVAITTNGERRAQTFDATGNLVLDADGTTYTYDAASRPVATTTADGITTSYEYWADGTRRSIERHDPASASRAAVELFWDGSTLVSERHSSGAATAPTASGEVAYLLGATRHARTTKPTGGDAQTTHFTSDRHGNITELTDDTGAIVERYVYGDYGTELEPGAQTLGLDRNPYRYAGEFTDVDGSQFLTERLYLPKFMRFASDDRAPEHNDYAFGHLNPIMMIDPSGRTPSADTIAGWVLAGLGAVVSVASIVGAVVTGGASMSLLGIGGWMLEGGALAATAMTVADQFKPFLSHDQRLALNITEMVLGGLSALAGPLGFAKHGKEVRAADRRYDELMEMWSPVWEDPSMAKSLVGARQGITNLMLKLEKDIKTYNNARMLQRDYYNFEYGRLRIREHLDANHSGRASNFVRAQSSFLPQLNAARQRIQTRGNVLTRSLYPHTELAQLDAIETKWASWTEEKISQELLRNFDLLAAMQRTMDVRVDITDTYSVAHSALNTHLRDFMFLERRSV